MNIGKTFYVAAFLVLSSCTLPVRAADRTITVQGFECGSGESVINWIITFTDSLGFGASNLTAGCVAIEDDDSDLQSVGVYAQLQQPNKPSTGFSKLTAYFKNISARDSYRHAEVRFRFRLTDNTLYSPVKTFAELGADAREQFQAIIVEAKDLPRDVSKATLESVAIYVVAGKDQGTKNLLMFGDIIVETTKDRFLCSKTLVDTKAVLGCQAIVDQGLRAGWPRPRPIRPIRPIRPDRRAR